MKYVHFSVALTLTQVMHEHFLLFFYLPLHNKSFDQIIS